MRVTIGKGGRITIPCALREQLALEPGAEVEVGVEDGAVVVRPLRDPDQWWFWTPEWQAGEREVDESIRRGEGRIYHSDEAFLAALDAAIETGEWPDDPQHI